MQIIYCIDVQCWFEFIELRSCLAFDVSSQSLPVGMFFKIFGALLLVGLARAGHPWEPTADEDAAGVPIENSSEGSSNPWADGDDEEPVNSGDVEAGAATASGSSGAAGATSGEPWVGFMASAAWRGDWENALEANIGSGRTSASVAAGGFFVLEIKKALEGIPKPP